jgi:hypothetical protein
MAPTVPPIAPPMPAPSAALVPSSVCGAPALPKCFLRVSSDMTRFTSFLP